MTETNSDGTQRLTEYKYAHEKETAMRTGNMLSQLYWTTVRKGSGNVESKKWTQWSSSTGVWRPSAEWVWIGDGTDEDTSAPDDPLGTEVHAVLADAGYDSYGRATKMTGGGGVNTAKLLRISRWAGAAPGDSRETKYCYYTSGVRSTLLSAITDENNHATEFDYDAFGHLTSVAHSICSTRDIFPCVGLLPRRKASSTIRGKRRIEGR